MFAKYILAFFGVTHWGCGGKWLSVRQTAFGTYSACSKCGVETYETDN